MRTKRSAVNIGVNVLGQVLNFILAIVSRSVLAKALPGEYLGINGLFYNILNILSLAELGIGTAMLYAFYAPVAEDNKREIQTLMNLYRTLYKTVAIAVTVLGLSLIPFLGYMMKDGKAIDNLVLIYLLYLLQSVSSYFFIYKTVILTANQQHYIVNLYTYSATVLRYLFQIGILLLTKNFFFYLLVQVFFTILPNIQASRKAQKNYPYIGENQKEMPPPEKKSSIYRNVKAVFIHKIASVLVYNTDNLIISAFVGLSSVGIYSNYKLISTNLMTLIIQVFTGITASIGNLAAKESEEKIEEVFFALNLLGFLLYAYCCISMAVLFRPFIQWIFGEKFLLEPVAVLLLLAQFYLTGMRQAVQQFRNAMGIFRQDKYRPVAEMILNVGISIFLAGKYGMIGILAGTVISLLLISVWLEPLILFKYGFLKRYKEVTAEFFKKYILRSFLMVVSGVGIWWICRKLPYEGFLGVFLQGLLCTFLYGSIMFVCFGRTREWKILQDTGMQMIKRSVQK